MSAQHKCPLCKSDKLLPHAGIVEFNICLSCGIHYSDVGEKDKPMTFEEWREKEYPGWEWSNIDLKFMKQAYEAGQQNSIK